MSDSLNVQQRYEEAIASYDKALDLKPDDTPAWGQRGTALQKLGRYDEAIVSYDRLLELEPNNYKLWHQRGLALRKLTQFEAAITSFDQALDVRPDFYPATRSKLFVLLTTGQILSYLTNQRSLLERTKLQNDLRNVFDSLVKTKLPALVVLALVAAQTTRSMTALGIAGIFLLIAIISDLIAEARQ